MTYEVGGGASVAALLTIIAIIINCISFCNSSCEVYPPEKLQEGQVKQHF